MKLHLKLIILFLLPIICFSQTDEEQKYTEIISNDFKGNDSLSIKIIYKEQIGCLGSYVGKINIKTLNGRLFFSHLSSNQETKSENFWATDKNTIDLIMEFETIGKKSKKRCGGFVGGTGYQVDLWINEKETKFGYCKKEFDGLGILIERITELKEKN